MIRKKLYNIKITETTFCDADLVDDEWAYSQKDNKFYNIYKGDKSVCWIGMIGCIRYAVDENYNIVGTALPMSPFDNGLETVTQSQINKWKKIIQSLELKIRLGDCIERKETHRPSGGWGRCTS